MELNILQPKEAKRKKKCLGRGIGTGKGKTSGRGHKGQKARSGVAIKGFEGGQMPIHRRLPKRGFNSLNREVTRVISFVELELFVKSNKISAQKLINKQDLISLGIVKKHQKIKLLSGGTPSFAIKIEVDSYSKLALEKITAAGGEIVKIDLKAAS